MEGRNLAASDAELTKLADDLDDMQDHLDKQVRRMDAIVDSIEGGWYGAAAKTYRKFHREAAEDAVRIREVMKLIEQAVRLSRDGFTQRELDTLQHFRAIQVSVDVEAEARELSTPNPDPAAPQRSRIHDF
ncbi:WXG100 family type VII secretion target [Streptomyces sp. NPDC051218]|uniref:WXG100 family type VII secretion target n=1 Tax=Streptomyces sp. NPDC051218 TaxID=3365645 RepID=UPI0037BCA551